MNESIEHGAEYRVTIYNEDDGTTITLQAGPGTPVRTVIARMYEGFRRQQQPNDRLRLNGSGEDLFPKADQHMRDVFADRDVRWDFAGDTGGA